MESEYGSQSSQHPRVEAEHVIVGELQPIISLEGLEFVQERGSSADSTSDSLDASSFSSDSSSDEFIQVDPIHHTTTLLAMSTKEEEEEEDENVVSNNAHLMLEEYLRSSSSNSRISDVTIESYIPDVSPTQSPPLIQVMERTEDFDPNRIPTSIFGKPSSPLDWSVASNESLFSIHIGNYSFSRDQIVVLGGDVDNTEEFSALSGELISSDNFYESKDPKLPGELVKCRENASEVPQNFVSCKAIVLEEALANNIPKRSINNDFKIKPGGLENKKDNRKAGTSIPSYTYPRKQSRCCCSMSACSCKWLICPTCSCCSSDSCCRSGCSCKRFCWPNCCCRSDVCWPCCNCKCPTWWNLCNCFSTCSSCCSRGFCSTSSWTCSIRNLFCCFSFQRSKNLQSTKASQRCRCCFSCSCCCS